MSLFEARIELIREDGVKVPALRMTPEFEAAAKLNGAGVVVVGGERGLGDEEYARILTPLCDHGYFVVALDLVRGGAVTSDEEAEKLAAALDHSIAIDDLVAGILTCKQVAAGKIGVIGIGAAAAVALEGATQLPHIDCVVHVDGPPPAKSARLARLRASLLIHRASEGRLLSKADCDDIAARAERSRAPIVTYDYPTRDGFFAHPRNDDEAFHSRVAWDRTRDFLSTALVG
ncbi:MAG: dienelactone hydrolase family protein [Kofleriaceae bacterium]|nr:dienelactone hydrolase family protein [Kofleriaceae bacterium]